MAWSKIVLKKISGSSVLMTYHSYLVLRQSYNCWKNKVYEVNMVRKNCFHRDYKCYSSSSMNNLCIFFSWKCPKLLSFWMWDSAFFTFQNHRCIRKTQQNKLKVMSLDPTLLSEKFFPTSVKVTPKIIVNEKDYRRNSISLIFQFFVFDSKFMMSAAMFPLYSQLLLFAC